MQGSRSSAPARGPGLWAAAGVGGAHRALPAPRPPASPRSSRCAPRSRLAPPHSSRSHYREQTTFLSPRWVPGAEGKLPASCIINQAWRAARRRPRPPPGRGSPTAASSSPHQPPAQQGPTPAPRSWGIGKRLKRWVALQNPHPGTQYTPSLRVLLITPSPQCLSSVLCSCLECLSFL
jgi:hypothetical protein